MSLKEKYPNLTGEESLPQVVREALSTVGIVNDARVTQCVVELFSELAAPLEGHLASLRTELATARQEKDDLAKELATFKPPAPPPPPAPTPSSEPPATTQAATTEPTKETVQ